jgi:hypothetical protein
MRTAEQNKLFLTLVRAMGGDGPSLEAVFATGEPPVVIGNVGTRLFDFYTAPQVLDYSSNEPGEWITMGTHQVLSPRARHYKLASEVVMKADRVAPSYGIRLLANGEVIGSIESHLGSLSSEIGHHFLREFSALLGLVTFEVQLRHTGAPAHVHLSLLHWSLRLSFEDEGAT